MKHLTTTFKTTTGRRTFRLIYSQKLGGGYEGKPSIFDNITPDDLILAFFPCVRFENQIMLFFRGQNKTQKNLSLEQKMKFDVDLLGEVKEMYDLVNYLFLICIQRNLRIVMENPYSEEHFLRRYWCYSPSIIDKDRTQNGDYFVKPTQYWFLNCEPKNNLLWEALPYNAIGVKDAIRKMTNKDASKMGAKNVRTARSMIHPDYANRFIRQYLIDEV